MRPQFTAVLIAIARCPCHHELCIRVNLLESLDEQMTSLFRGEPPKKKNIASRLQSPLENLAWRTALPQNATVRNIKSGGPVLLAVSLLQCLRNNHRSIRTPHRSFLSEAQHSSGETSPLATLPIEALDRDRRPDAHEPGQE